MRVLQRMRAVMLSPRSGWAGIAAAADSPHWLFRRYLPAAVGLGWVSILLASLFAGDRDPASRTQQTAHFRREADGTLTQIAVGEKVSLPAFESALLALPLLLGAAVASVLVLRALVLWRAPRFGAPRDRDAATRLAVFAFTPAWLSLAVPDALGLVAGLVSLAAPAYVLVLLYQGAPRLLPPAPGQERAFGRSAVLMALLALLVLLVLAVPVTLVIGIVAAAIAAVLVAV